MKLKAVIVAIGCGILIAGCGRMSADDLSKHVAGMVQEEMLKNLQQERVVNAKVEIMDISLVHINGNKYEGLANVKVSGNGGVFLVKESLDVTFDGENVMLNMTAVE